MKWNVNCVIWFDNCLDLPSLTQIRGNQQYIHCCMGYVILESMIWFDLIWFDLIWLDIPNLTENNIHYRNYSFKYTSDLQSTSTFPFHFHFIFTFRCFCSWKCHSKNVEIFVKLNKTAFLSLAERRRKSRYVVVEFVVSLFAVNSNHSANLM